MTETIKNKEKKKWLSAGMGASLLLSAMLTGCAEQGGTTGITDLTAGITGENKIPEPGQEKIPVKLSSGGIPSVGDKAVDGASVEDSAAVSDFALKLLHQSLQDESLKTKNVLISPVSVLYALSMTANGAEGQTLAQMEAALGAPVSAWNSYLSRYRSSLSEEEGCKFSLANSIWLRDDPGLKIQESFLKTNADWYGADIYKAPFNASTVQAINQWVSDSTDKMIPSILDEISADTMMYLINGLAFDAEWASPYQQYQTHQTDFTEEDGTRYLADLMYSSEHLYLQDEKAKGFLKYYKGGKYAFAALLPNQGISVLEYVDSLDGQALTELLSNPVSTAVTSAIPKFKTDYSADLKEVFKSLGMTDAFDLTADFSGMGSFSGNNLYIGRILHKTYIAVDEQGTEAGAATALEILCGSAAMPVEKPKEVYLDRPFVYMIVDCEEKIPVFIGTLMSAK